jgi:hypothetical protein
MSELWRNHRRHNSPSSRATIAGEVVDRSRTGGHSCHDRPSPIFVRLF